MTEIEGIDNKKYKPYENTGIQEGDRIISINNTNIEDTEDLVKRVNSSNGNVINIKYVHEQKTLECSIKPVKTSNTEYKLGLWVRDSAAGVGTVTFYEPSTKSFGALGHGITDIDTEQLIDISSGEFVTTKILNPKCTLQMYTAPPKKCTFVKRRQSFRSPYILQHKNKILHILTRGKIALKKRFAHFFSVSHFPFSKCTFSSRF